VLPYTLLDVFTDVPLAGNGLAAVLDADGLDDAVMLGFARETRLNETTFVQSPTVAEASYRNRIWTITEELPFAGHPSLGTAVAVALARGETTATYVQETPAGLQPLVVERDGDRAHASVLTEPAVFGAEVEGAAAMAAVGLPPDAAHPGLPPQLVSTGLPTLIVPVRDADAVAAARPDRRAVERLHHEDFNFYLCWHDTRSGAVRARSFPGPPAEPEDPATGSAAGALLAYLHERVGAERVEIAQGLEIRRPSRLVAERDGDRVRVGGDVVVLVTGTVRLP
jgi:trans-2,3-dihydro-3-hydroxyanthranilate isomerase